MKSPYRIFSFVVFSLSFSLTTSICAANKKIALIIGNGTYQYATPLKNPVNDAIDNAKTLQKLEFKVRLVTDVSLKDIEFAVEEFIAKLTATKCVGVMFYAGHGSQLERNNYLIPVDVTVQAEHELKEKAFNIALLPDALKKAKNETNIIILDACRDNPFAGGFKNASRSLSDKGTDRAIRLNTPVLSAGLSKLDVPPNTLIAFATAPGKVAADGEGRNSPYTKQLIRSMQREGLTVEQVFKEVRGKMLAESQGKQIPWESSSLVSDFYFKPRRSIPTGW